MADETGQLPSGEVDAKREPAPGSRAELIAALRRMEATLDAIREQVEAEGRRQRHREFSPGRLIGALLQALVIGFLVAALADWVYAQELGQQLVKIGLAAVLQLGALTAFTLARRGQ